MTEFMFDGFRFDGVTSILYAPSLAQPQRIHSKNLF
jgi:1,4-alpha-glucan branching enzyme